VAFIVAPFFALVFGATLPARAPTPARAFRGALLFAGAFLDGLAPRGGLFVAGFFAAMRREARHHG